MKRQKLFGLREKTKPALTSKRDSSVAFTISHISPLLSISAVTTPAVSQIRILLTLLPPRPISHNICVLTCCTFWNPFVFSAEACLHYRQPAQGLTHQLFSRKYFPLWSSATNLNSVRRISIELHFESNTWYFCILVKCFRQFAVDSNYTLHIFCKICVCFSNWLWDRVHRV